MYCGHLQYLKQLTKHIPGRQQQKSREKMNLPCEGAERLHLCFPTQTQLPSAGRSCPAALHAASSPKLALLPCKGSGSDTGTAPRPPRAPGPGARLSMEPWGWKTPLRSPNPALPCSPLNHPGASEPPRDGDSTRSHVVDVSVTSQSNFLVRLERFGRLCTSLG